MVGYFRNWDSSTPPAREIDLIFPRPDALFTMKDDPKNGFLSDRRQPQPEKSGQWLSMKIHE